MQNAGAGSLSRSRERDRVRARELRKTSPDAERTIWKHLRSRQLDGYKFRRQHPIGPFFADFACIEAGLVVELDGGQHFELDAVRRDEYRTAFLQQAGFHVLRFDDRQALTETAGVLQSILEWLHLHHPHPSPLPQAGEGVPFIKD
ncbi:MAG TPA: endonuclease domain-containing protein [Burkholderiaceae bacterium]